MPTYIKYIALFISLISPFVTAAHQLPKAIVKGIVLDAQNKETLPGATVIFKNEIGKSFGVATDEKGNFIFRGLYFGSYKTQISFVGYEDEKRIVSVDKDTVKVIFMLQPSATLLEAAVVTASESKDLTSASKIDRNAMEHLQPTSFTDILALLPGGSTKTPNMTAPNIISLREVPVSSSDYNTSALGTQFVIDGTPISTDAQMQYVKGEISSGLDWKTSINSGVDMRTISTDNIESVEIIRGIPSVEYGDLTSGVVVIKRKLHGTPFEARFKADQYSKLVSAGKGLEWKEKKAVLMFDAGFLDSKADPRNPMENYKRINFSTRFQKEWELGGGHMLRWNTNADYGGNIDVQKIDPEIQNQPEDSYRSTYHSVKWNNTLRWSAPKGMIFRNLDWNFSAAYSMDRIERTRFVQLDRDRVIADTFEEGIHDAEILPYKYVAQMTVDGKPLNLYSNLKANFKAKTGIVDHRFFVGTTWTFNKNYGGGQIYDMKRPLNPMAGSMRPRKYSDIPGMHQLSFFVQENLNMPVGRHRFEVQAGVRANSMLSVDNRYTMHGKFYFDPRLNLQWVFPGIPVGEHELVFSLSGGVGWLTKMPTMLQLYPDKTYIDFMQLNYWNQNADYKRVNVYTYVEDPTNFELEPARNFKWEVRLNMSCNWNELSVTYFRENMSNGFRSMAHYQPYDFRDYDEYAIDGNALTGPPSLDGLPYVDRTVLDGYGYTGNGSATYKEGVEFQFASKRFNFLNSRLTVNGAWFRTRYENSVPLFRSVYEIVNGEQVSNKYVGLYENEDNYEREMFNTNFIYDVWLRKIGVKLSLTLECTWFSADDHKMVDGVPIAYMDTTGQMHEYTEEDKTDLYKQHLIFHYNEAAFERKVTPFFMYMNFKATKDFAKYISISLFADRILDVVPNFTRHGKYIRRTGLSPYFGMELNFRF